MSRQIVKGLTVMTLIVGLALATAAISANAQVSNQVRVDVPFKFIVGERTLNQGTYVVTDASVSGELLLVRGNDSKSNAYLLARRTSGGRNKKPARMVFHRYGEQYFLAEVWSNPDNGKLIEKSKAEKELEQQLVSNGSKSDVAKKAYETVEVVAIVR
jgi:hypothetical protein